MDSGTRVREVETALLEGGVPVPPSSAPPHYHDSEHQERNGAAVLSLICAIAWPPCLLIPVAFTIMTGGPKLPGPVLPQVAAFTVQCVFGLLPRAGIVAGVIGLYRAATQPQLRCTRGRALAGLLLGC
ncbi:MAG: hypothetical protein ACM3N4_11915, partial [Nitrososphaerota archaeon]